MRSSRRRLLELATVVALGAWAYAPAAPAGGAEYKLSAAPVASFIWFPVTPRVGEKVTMVSTSSDLTSPIVRFGWDLSDNGPFGQFVTGGPSSTTVFTTPAPHVVRLRVTNREGLSSVASETIHMAAGPAGVIAPFPIVRIVGSRTRSGVRLRLLSVEAPRDATIAVACHAKACPRVVRHIRASASGRGSHFLSFRRYARGYPAGSKLEVRVTKAGFVGAYTSFAIKRHRIPRRVDSCLSPGGAPMACPA